MPNFTTEADVRAKFHVPDEAHAPAALIARSIDDAHLEILRLLDPQYDVEPPDAALVLGETLLAGALLFRSLAAREGVQQKRVSLGGHRIEEGRRFDSLHALSLETAFDAWQTLAPFLLGADPRQLARATATQPIFSED